MSHYSSQYWQNLSAHQYSSTQCQHCCRIALDHSIPTFQLANATHLSSGDCILPQGLRRNWCQDKGRLLCPLLPAPRTYPFYRGCIFQMIEALLFANSNILFFMKRHHNSISVCKRNTARETPSSCNIPSTSVLPKLFEYGADRSLTKYKSKVHHS